MLHSDAFVSGSIKGRILSETAFTAFFSEIVKCYKNICTVLKTIKVFETGLLLKVTKKNKKITVFLKNSMFFLK